MSHISASGRPMTGHGDEGDPRQPDRNIRPAWLTGFVQIFTSFRDVVAFRQCPGGMIVPNDGRDSTGAAFVPAFSRFTMFRAGLRNIRLEEQLISFKDDLSRKKSLLAPFRRLSSLPVDEAGPEIALGTVPRAGKAC